ncbi:MAG: copper chaperone PCu(A)C [Proteobacteria bacterium]|nr:MAG: copper chaperone PCu(A)C [Pseudomonadota bacterium]
MKAILAPALCLVSIFGSAAFAAPEAAIVTFTNARIIEPVKGANVTAAYAVIKNETGKPMTLVISQVAPFKAIEMHETYEKDEKMGMRRIENLTVAAHESFELKPGGNHLMLFDPSREVKAGEQIEATFIASGKTIKTNFKVVKRGEKMNDHDHH